MTTQCVMRYMRAMTPATPGRRASLLRRLGRWATLVPVVAVLPAYVALIERGWQPLAATVALLALTMTLLLALERALPRGGLGVRPPGTLRLDIAYVVMSGAINVAVPMLVLAPLAAASPLAGRDLQLWPRNLPFWLDVLLFTLLADFISYVWHRLEHDPRFPLLWRIHAVHHAPRYFDVMMGGHVHPLDVLVFVALTAGLGLLLGVPVATIDATMLFAGVIGAIHHLDAETDLGWLNRLIPFADHHTVHHSRAPQENGNFGNITTIFDQLFGT